LRQLRIYTALKVKPDSEVPVDPAEMLGCELRDTVFVLIEGISRLPASAEVRELLEKLHALQVEIAEAGFPPLLDESDVS